MPPETEGDSRPAPVPQDAAAEAPAPSPPRVGSIAVSGDWEMRSQITLLEPEHDPGPDPRLDAADPPPRANIVISRQAGTGQTPEQARADFLHSAQDIPKLQIHAEDTVIFADGAAGASVVLSFAAKPHIDLAQRHVFRIDGSVLTQIVATVDLYRLRELDDHLLELVRTFRD